MPIPSNRLDLVGKRFDRLLVLELQPSDGSGFSKWLCLCDCGTKKVITGYCLTRRTGKIVRSCGCLLSETGRNKFYKHGASVDPARANLHRLWSGIKRRCLKPTECNYKYYGGRGISIAPEWKDDFPAFEKYVLENMGPRPSLQHSIDRMDVNGNYEPGNIRWATPKQQYENRRPTRKPEPNELCGVSTQDGLCRNRIKAGAGPCWRHPS